MSGAEAQHLRNEEFSHWLAEQRAPTIIERALRAVCADKPTDILGGLLTGLSTEITARTHESSVAKASELTIVHFNDIYNIEESAREPVGGVARFKGFLNTIRDKNPALIFSGDAFNPSIMSTVCKGEQVPPALNELDVQCACVGNHDFDFGVDRLKKLVAKCNFPWMLGNIYEIGTKVPFAGLLSHHIFYWEGRKIGCLAVVESEWMETLQWVQKSDFDYEDFVIAARRLALQLRAEDCDLVLAVTHCRMPNDFRLAEEVPEIDMILGGHDHHYEAVRSGCHGMWVLNSGCDFRQCTVITIKFGEEALRQTKQPVGAIEKSRKLVITCDKVDITKAIAPDPVLLSLVKFYQDIVGARMEKVVGSLANPMDVRFAMVRTQETNGSNFVADICRSAVRAEIAIINSGSLRADTIFPAGPFKVRDLTNLYPNVSPLTVIKLKGSDVLKLLENGVSAYPKMEGRFPAVSGVRMSFNSLRPPGFRVVEGSVTVNGHPLELQREYSVATTEYLSEGKDGFDAFKNGTVLVESENCPDVGTALMGGFKALQIMKKFHAGGKTMAKAFGLRLHAMSKGQQDDGINTPFVPTKGVSGLEEYSNMFKMVTALDGRVVRVDA